MAKRWGVSDVTHPGRFLHGNANKLQDFWDFIIKDHMFEFFGDFILGITCLSFSVISSSGSHVWGLEDFILRITCMILIQDHMFEVGRSCSEANPPSAGGRESLATVQIIIFGPILYLY